MTAEGSLYQRKDGRWVAQYRDAKDKVRYIYRRTKAEAMKALREALQDRDEGFVPADKLTVGLYLDEWMDERRNTVSARTWRVQESMIRNRVNKGLVVRFAQRLLIVVARLTLRRSLTTLLVGGNQCPCPSRAPRASLPRSSAALSPPRLGRRPR